MWSSWSLLLRLVLPVFWLGLLVGVSFLATPVKFQAPSLELPVALDVGRVTFALFNRVEWVLVLLSILAALISGFPRGWSLLLGLIAFLLALQTFWLLPELNERIRVIITGEVPPASRHHMFYALLETVKSLTLLGMFIVSALRFSSLLRR